MSVYASIDESEPTMMASNHGWSEFAQWVRTLSVDDNAELIHLVEHAWSEDLVQAGAQLKLALSDSAPGNPDVRTVAMELLGLLEEQPGDAVMTINDGLVAELPASEEP